jgi:glycosyltransferase involved in cell wall biosynthesis
MCTFNGERFLVDQIESILQQDHQNFRIWISDDGSTDGTMDVLEAYRARLGGDRFAILRGPGQGFAANFLSLLRRPDIEADYFAFADQDDICETTRLSNAISLIGLEVAGLPVVYSSRSRLVDCHNIEIGLSRAFRRPPSFRNAIIQSIGGGNTMVIDRWARDLACLAQVRSIVSHDWWLYMLVTGAGGKMIFDTVPATRYRQHDGNLVGMNLGWKMKLQRLRMLVGGQFKQWNDLNISALQDSRHLLTPENRRVLDQFSAARDATLVERLAGIWRSGAYRQTVMDEVVVFLAILARRV